MSSLLSYENPSLDSLFRYARSLKFGDIHFKVDPATGLIAIIAIHNRLLGNAIGGCRCLAYSSLAQGLKDALRLAYMMSFKAAAVDLPHGGAKSVIIRPKKIKDAAAFYASFGEFVESLNGQYIAAVDSGTSPAEMDFIAKKTRFVSCTSNLEGAGDPSPQTAYGLRRAIEAAVFFQNKMTSLAGLRVAIQGAGHVGISLARELIACGAELIMTDTNPAALQKASIELGVRTCAPEDIYHQDVDIFSPCALGSILNADTIDKIRAHMIIGSANNQLAHARFASVLHEKNILYIPDFLVNAGGLIQVAVTYSGGKTKDSMEKVAAIYDKVLALLEEAKTLNLSPQIILEKKIRTALKL